MVRLFELLGKQMKYKTKQKLRHCSKDLLVEFSIKVH